MRKIYSSEQCTIEQVSINAKVDGVNVIGLVPKKIIPELINLIAHSSGGVMEMFKLAEHIHPITIEHLLSQELINRGF